jgi:hypothetical protein
MVTNLRNPALIAAVLVAGLAETAAAQAPVGTRAAGMAGAFVAVADDASAVYWNPAGIASGSLVSMIIDFGSGEAVPRNPQTAAAQQDTAAIVGVSATAFGVAYYRLGAYGTSTAQPAVSAPPSREEVRRSVHALTTSTVGVSLLHSLTEHVVVGVTPKLVRGSARRGVSASMDAHDALDTAKALDGPATNAFDVDAAVMVTARRFRLGAVARNLTTPAFDTGVGPVDVIEIDREVRVGAAWGSGWTGISRVIVSVDGDLKSHVTPAGDRREVAAGIETWWRNQRLGLRGGVRRSTIGDARAALAAGLSAALRPGMLLEAHVLRGQGAERSWSIGARVLY